MTKNTDSNNKKLEWKEVNDSKNTGIIYPLENKYLQWIQGANAEFKIKEWDIVGS